MTELVGGALFRWDTGRYVETVAPEVHFCLDGGRDVLAVRAGGGRCRVPDELLASGADIMAFEADGRRTLSRARLRVQGRPKPPDWHLTPTEVVSVTGLREWVEERFERLEYSSLRGKPSVNGTVLDGDLTGGDIGLGVCRESDIDDIFAM